MLPRNFIKSTFLLQRCVQSAIFFQPKRSYSRISDDSFPSSQNTPKDDIDDDKIACDIPPEQLHFELFMQFSMTLGQYTNDEAIRVFTNPPTISKEDAALQRQCTMSKNLYQIRKQSEFLSEFRSINPLLNNRGMNRDVFVKSASETEYANAQGFRSLHDAHEALKNSLTEEQQEKLDAIRNVGVNEQQKDGMYKLQRLYHDYKPLLLTCFDEKHGYGNENPIGRMLTQHWKIRNKNELQRLLTKDDKIQGILNDTSLAQDQSFKIDMMLESNSDKHIDLSIDWLLQYLEINKNTNKDKNKNKNKNKNNNKNEKNDLKILDIGCRNGTFGIKLKKKLMRLIKNKQDALFNGAVKNVIVDGFDVSKAAISSLKDNLEEDMKNDDNDGDRKNRNSLKISLYENNDLNYDICLQDMCNWNFSGDNIEDNDGKYDVLISNNFLGQLGIAGHPGIEAIAELMPFVKNGGIFVMGNFMSVQHPSLLDQYIELLEKRKTEIEQFVNAGVKRFEIEQPYKDVYVMHILHKKE